MKNLYLSVCCIFFFFLVGCQSLSRQPIDVENLQLKMPIPEDGWTRYEKNEGALSSAKWVKTNEQFTVSILHRRPVSILLPFLRLPDESLQNRRAGLDGYVKKNMATQFTSTVLFEDTVNNYPQLIWQTMMIDKKGERTDAVSLLVRGNDATYLIVKTWDDTPDFGNEKDQWLEYMKSIEVADPRSPEHTSSKTITPSSKGWVSQSK